MTAIKVTETPIAWWEPTTTKGSRLVLYRRESSRFGLTYSYRGDGASGGIQATSDSGAIALVESNVLPYHKKLKRAGDRPSKKSSSKKRRTPQRDIQLPLYDAYAPEPRTQARHAKPRNEREADEFYEYLIRHHYLSTVAFSMAYSHIYSPARMKQDLQWLAWYEHGKGQRSYQPGTEPKRPKKSWLDRLIG